MNCPTVPDHGRLLDRADGRFYCPHQGHDRASSPFFTEAQVFAFYVPREERRPIPAGRRSSRRTAG